MGLARRRMHFPTSLSDITLVALVLVWGGCADKAAQTARSAESYYQHGMKLMAKKEYVQAKEQFERIISSFPGSDWVDEAQFQLAEAYFHSEDYVSAAFEYERVREDFALSPLVDDAQYKLALCFFRQSPRPELDQENTYRAIEELTRFVEDYPQSPLVQQARDKILECRTRLARKDYLNGRFYLRSGDSDAALIYFRAVLDGFGDTRWSAYAQFGVAECLLQKKGYEDALEAYQLVASGNGSEVLKSKARRRMAEIQKRLNHR